MVRGERDLGTEGHMALTDDVEQYLASEKAWVERISQIVRSLRTQVEALEEAQVNLQNRLADLEERARDRR
jgi:hypothetical protein